jgi:hypothetical protein
VPRAGVTNVGDVAKTSAPEPVSSDTAAAICAEVAVNVLLDKFIVLLVSVSVVALPTKVSVEVGNVNVPVLTIELITGVTSVGDVDKTTFPEPVEVVTPVPPLATDKVPVVPATIGSPVQLVKVPELGVPRTGVTSVGEVESTTFPEPVEVVTPVPPLATDSVPVVPATIGNPVQLVKVPEVGVPNAGVTNVNDSA